MYKFFKILIVAIIFLFSHNALIAQEADSTILRPSFELVYTGELQTDFDRSKFVNLLRLRGELPLSKHLSFNVASVSVATSDELPLIGDLQGISSIDAWNIPFALNVAGFTWNINDRHSLFAGIRNMDEDYFCSEGLALFANPSCGGFPAVTANYAFPNYPLAAMGIHYAYDSEKLGIQASYYNGTGSYTFTGSDNVFRFCPKSDGIFALGQVEYRHKGSKYFLGASIHNRDLLWLGGKKIRPCAWIYAEQSLTPSLMLLAGYAHAFDSDEFCKNFCALGAKYTYRNMEFGIFSDYTRMLGVDEWATELTCRISTSKYLTIQPVFHIIKTDKETNCVGMLRFNVSL